MNECLVTALKGVLSNPDLPLFDKVVFHLTGSEISIKLTPVTGKTISFSGSDGTERTFDGTNWLALTPNVTYIACSAADIIGIQAQTYIGNWPKGLMQVPGLTIFAYDGHIMTSDLPVPDNIENLVLIDRDVDKMDTLITWLQELKESCQITLQGKTQSMPYIPMATIATFAHGTATFGVVSSTAQGSIEEFVHVRRTTYEQPTGSLSFDYLFFDPVTFNGSRIEQPSGSTTCQLSWTADTITFDGVTISA